MAAMRRCLRCGHEWLQRTGTPPRTCPRCRSPYWNRQRRGEEMSPVAELERALDERRQMEESLRKRREKMESRLAEATLRLKRIHAEKLAAAERTRDLSGKEEISEKEKREIEKLERKIESLNGARARFETETTKLHEALSVLGPAGGPVSEGAVSRDHLSRDLLLEILDEDAGNELFVEGARRYARRLAERIRGGEFDGA